MVPDAKTCLSAESAATAAPEGIGVHAAATGTRAAAAKAATTFETDRLNFIGNPMFVSGGAVVGDRLAGSGYDGGQAICAPPSWPSSREMRAAPVTIRSR